ncbi:MAG: sigma-54 dependent transcriptional regulator [Candidatus Aminicenantes bacterium]|nr:sigma-54 dependent transcriptional regulator [Candidatus Aminicenantes bacterium]
MIENVNILVIDDEETIRDACRQILKKEGYSVKTAEDGIEGLRLFRTEFFHAVLLDLKLPDMDGMEILSQIKEEHPKTPVIIITGYASIDSAIEAMKRGASDYLSKPFSPEQLRLITKKSLDSRKMLIENIYLREELEKQVEFNMVIGKSTVMERVLDIVKRISSSDSTVLITGESGTGKEILAREIHNHSPRRNAPFVVVDCGALVETLFESELFGHVKGSFTGAHETKHGRFEVANGGTIFLDEISNISLNIQAKLLRVIQEREVTRVGSNKPIKVDVRILAATNENLADLVRKEKFREDLFYRLSVVPLNLPPLRERKEDIPFLIDHFINKYCKKTRKDLKGVSPSVKKALMEYDWPGNIRELENTIERAVVLTKGEKIELEDLVYHGISASSSLLLPVGGKYKSLNDIEKEYIKIVLQAQHGNKSRTAKILKIDRKTLMAKIKKYKIQ